MFVETPELVAERMRDPTLGLAHYLPLVPVSAGHAPPPAVPPEQIHDETLNGEVALDRIPGPYPAIAISLIPSRMGEETTAREVGYGRATVLLRYATDRDDPHIGTRDAGYTLRAAIWVLKRLHMDLAPGALPPRNGIQFYGHDDFELSPVYAPIEGAVVTGWLKVPYDLRDVGFPG
ncbi:MAG: hypothetical protein HOP28_09345 [Gemmatimonadales bacterium]|nr:hypothetical protein [Gemmatimonadales bacterium]